MICAPRQLAGDIKAGILAIVSLRVCSGPQQTRLYLPELATERNAGEVERRRRKSYIVVT